MDQLSRRLETDFGLTPVVATEIEFYLHNAPAEMLAFWHAVNEKIPVAKYEKERGKNQFEVALAPTSPQKAVADIIALKKVITDTAEEQGMHADFSAKPFADQPGSGLHIHIHLEDSAGKNVYYKHDAEISDALKFSIGGLLAALPKSMEVFAPTEASRARFTPGGYAPTTISWGANNRTVAVRLPDKPHANKHIEHRVAGADADPKAVISCILEAIHDGLTRKLDPGPQVYGDASLEMYHLPKLA